MLLAVPGMAEAGDLGENRIRFDPALLERYMTWASGETSPQP